MNGRTAKLINRYAALLNDRAFSPKVLKRIWNRTPWNLRYEGRVLMQKAIDERKQKNAKPQQ